MPRVGESGTSRGRVHAGMQCTGPLEGDMTPRRSRGRRLVLVAAALLAVLLGGCATADPQQAELARPQGSRVPEDLQPLHADHDRSRSVVGVAIVVATVVLAIKFRYRPGINENPKQIHGNTKLEIGWTIVPALILAVIAVPTVSTIFDLAKNPGPERPAGHRRGQAVVVAVQLPRREGRHRRRAGDPDRAPGQGAPHRVRRHRRRQDLQRDPLVLGARSSTARRTSCPGTTTGRRSRPTSPAPTSGSAPSTAASRTPTCASA